MSKKKIFDMGKNFSSTYSAGKTVSLTANALKEAIGALEDKKALFIPEIWSKKLLEKFYSESIIDKLYESTAINLMKRAAEKVEELRREGLPESLIELELEKYMTSIMTSIQITATEVKVRSNIGSLFGVKVVSPITAAILKGVTS